MNKFHELKEVILAMDDDAYKFYFRLNGAAGRRLRKKLQVVKKLALEIRAEILIQRRDQ